MGTTLACIRLGNRIGGHMVKEIRQCSSCGGICKKSGCERAKVEPINPFERVIAEQQAKIDQLKQAVRDALELAFQVAGPEDSYQDERFKAKADSAMRVRALIKEI